MTYAKTVLAAFAIFISGCSTITPIEMTLSDPLNRKINDEAGFNNDISMRRCSENMLNASPAVSAANINPHIVSVSPLRIDVDAMLTNMGPLNQSLAVTYRCEYVNRKMTLGTWTKGFDRHSLTAEKVSIAQQNKASIKLP